MSETPNDDSTLDYDEAGLLVSGVQISYRQYPFFVISLLVGLFLLKSLLEYSLNWYRPREKEELRPVVANWISIALHVTSLGLVCAFFVGLQAESIQKVTEITDTSSELLRIASVFIITAYVAEWVYLLKLEAFRVAYQIATIAFFQVLIYSVVDVGNYLNLGYFLALFTSLDCVVYLVDLTVSEDMLGSTYHITIDILYLLGKTGIFVWGWFDYTDLMNLDLSGSWYNFWVVAWVLFWCSQYTLSFVLGWRQLQRRPPIEHDQSLHPLERGTENWLSQLTFAWLTPLSNLAYQRRLKEADVFPMPLQDRSDAINNLFEECWHAESHRLVTEHGPVHNEQVQLQDVLYYAYRHRLWGLLMSHLLFAIATTCNPVFFRLLYNKLDSDQKDWTAFGYALGFCFCLMGTALFAAMANSYANFLGVNLRTALINAVYRKSLKLSAAARQANGSASLNLVSSDAQRLWMMIFLGGQAFRYPFLIISCLCLLYWQVEWVAFVTLATMSIALAIMSYFGFVMNKSRKSMLRHTDRRVQLSSEFVHNAELIKMSGWDDLFYARIVESREGEMHSLWDLFKVRIMNTSFVSVLPVLAPVVTYITYISYYGSIDMTTVFTSMIIIAIMQPCFYSMPRVLASLAEGFAAMRRLESFLHLPEINSIRDHVDASHRYYDNDYDYEAKEGETLSTFSYDETKPAIFLKDGVFEWPVIELVHQEEDADDSNSSNSDSPTQHHADSSRSGQSRGLLSGQDAYSSEEEEDHVTDLEAGSSSSSSSSLSSFRVTNVNLRASRGSLVCIVGAIGSGKTSLARAIMGDMTMISGDRRLTECYAYASDNSWMQLGSTIEESILMGMTRDERIYTSILKATKLDSVLSKLPGGDKFVYFRQGDAHSLSDSVRLKISLARAVYRVLIMDDIISATNRSMEAIRTAQSASAMASVMLVIDGLLEQVSRKESQHIITNLLGDAGLLANHTRVIVTQTSQVSLLSQADHIMILDQGCVVGTGTYQELLDDENTADLLLAGAEEDNASGNMDDEDDEDDSAIAGIIDVLDEKTAKKLPNSNLVSSGASVAGEDAAGMVEEETDTHDSVDWQLIWKYFETGFGFHGAWLLLIIFALFGLAQGIAIYADVWAASFGTVSWDSANRGYYLGIYVLIFGFLCLAATVRSWFFYYSMKKMSDQIHQTAIRNLAHAKSEYFEAESSGVILNKLTKDLDSVDLILPDSWLYFLFDFAYIVGALCLCLIDVYALAFVLLPVMAYMIYARQVIAKCSQDLKRLESQTRSPIVSTFSQTLDGMDMIQVYSVDSKYQENMSGLVDKNTKLFFHANQMLCWTQAQLGGMGALVVFFIVCFLIIFEDYVSSTVSGLIVTYSGALMGRIPDVILLSVDLVNYLTQAQRMLDFDQVPQESLLGEPVSDQWPRRGRIEFEMVTMTKTKKTNNPSARNSNNNDASADQKLVDDEKDDDDLETNSNHENTLTLMDKVSFSLPAAEHLAVLDGRQAEKGVSDTASLLMKACLRTGGDVSQGSITIDGVNTSLVSVRDLRSRIAVVPKTPTIFTGTILSNIDPSGKASRQQVWQALEATQMGELVMGRGQGLDSVVMENGSNLSIGQRKVICLARAVLRKNQGSRIIFTDNAVQGLDSVRDQMFDSMDNIFKDCTVIEGTDLLTRAVVQDKVLIMTDGRVTEFGAPADLLTGKPGHDANNPNNGAKTLTSSDTSSSSSTRTSTDEKTRSQTDTKQSEHQDQSEVTLQSLVSQDEQADTIFYLAANSQKRKFGTTQTSDDKKRSII